MRVSQIIVLCFTLLVFCSSNSAQYVRPTTGGTMREFNFNNPMSALAATMVMNKAREDAVAKQLGTNPNSNRSSTNQVSSQPQSQPSRPYADIWIETAFEARGNDGPMRYSGKICSLTDDFRVTVTHPLISYDIYFFPYYKGNVSDSPDALRGRFSYEAKRGMLVSSGYGVYEVKGWDTDHPVIICNENSEAHGPMIGGSGKGVAVIELAPTSQACGGK